jgi:uncharacterized SAM-binding protein YcdF (DUF218 family)
MVWHDVAVSLLTLPGLLILLFILGFLVHLKKDWLGATILGISTALLIALSLPLTAHQLIAGLEIYPALKGPLPERGRRDSPEAIVILGGGRYSDAPEYNVDTVDGGTLERLRYGAFLYRKTGLPILVSGGAPRAETTAEAELMRAALLQDFNVPVKWLETRSRDTIENARFSKELLKTAGVKRIYLVTHAWHMRRAVQLFEKAGVTVVPAPTIFTTLSRREYNVPGYLPSAYALKLSSIALHERWGYWWNQWRG